MNRIYNRVQGFLLRKGLFLLMMIMSLVSSAQLTENFSSATFPAGSGWTLKNDPAYPSLLAKRTGTVNGYGSTNGVGAIYVDFWDGPWNLVDTLISPTLNATLAGDTLMFDHIHATAFGQTIHDSMAIWCSSDNGVTWTPISNLVGNPTLTGCQTCLSTFPGAMLTAMLPPPAVGGTPPINSNWMTKKYALPIGTNKVMFRFCSNYGQNMFLDNIVVTRNTPMTYSDAYAAQVIDTVFQSMDNAPILNIQVSAINSASPLPVTEVYANTSGSTSTSDILAAKLYYTGGVSGFNIATATLLATVNNPSGKISFTGFTQPLAGALSNFWVAYDVSPTATVGNVLDATFDSIKVAAVNRIPSATNPVGNRYIKSFSSYIYCQFSVLYPGGYLIGPTNVTFGTINNSSADYAKVTNYATQINTMVQGDSAIIKVSIGPGNAEQVGIYVDWNNNGVFDLPAEEVYYASNITAGSFTGSGLASTATNPPSYIRIPCNASPGYHRMRVASDASIIYGVPKLDACGTKYYGEAEDYTLQILKQPIPVASYTVVDTFYTNGMVVFTNTSTGSNLSYQWDYTNDGTFDATTLNGANQYPLNGSYFCKLKITSTGCLGIYTDEVIHKVVIISPPAITIAGFISDKNVVATTDLVTFFDLSTYGPGSWSWIISPATVGGNTAYFYQNGTSSSSQNPQVLFTQLGKFTVSLTATNTLGSSTITKGNYINCVSSVNMCGGGLVATSSDDAGFLYDDGGKYGNYTPSHNGSNQCTMLIKPGCASTVSLKFTMFDMSIYQTPGGDYLKVYDGINATGVPLHAAIGWPAGIQNLINNVSWLPPTLIATSGAMYIEYWVDNAFQAKGFAAEWSTTPIIGTTPPTATFNVPDTIYTGVGNTFICTASGTGNSYDWDFNNDGVFDASGASVTYTYASTTSTIVKCVVSSCMGTTTITKSVLVLVPSVAPTPLFTANFYSGTPVDIFQLLDASKNGPTSWQWTISPATYTIITGSLNSQNISVQFTQLGAYLVKLKVSNAFGSDSLTKSPYLRVIYYCTPNVNIMNPDIGISNVSFASINNTSPQGMVAYTNYSNLGATNMELGASYPITIKRTTNTNAINRRVWMDLNGNGSFIDAGEMLFEEASSTTLSVTGSVMIPITAALGSTRLRVGVNAASLPNLGCGANYFGEYEDYKITIIADKTKPVITLIGADTVYTEVGRVYTDAGATATDNVTTPQTYTATYNGFVNGTAFATAGLFSVTYTAIDGTGNSAITKTRIIIVTPDITKPIIVLNGADTIQHPVGTPWVDPGATASDFFFGPITPVTIFGAVNINVVGSYPISYSVTDLHGNASVPKVRIVLVVDLVKPIITVNGANPFYWDVHRKPFVDPGVIGTDNYCTSGLAVIASTINLDSIGTYTITYSLKDCNGNTAVAKTRTVIVQDTVRPTLTFALNTDTFLIDVKTLTAVPEPGYTLADNYYSTSQLTVSKLGAVNLNVIGDYPVAYKVIDLSSNESKVNIRVFRVVDREKPEIKLVGSSVQNVFRWKVYNDSGATITDNYYLSLVPVVGGFIDVNLAGIYYLTFNITDPSGNAADQKIRIVNVKESIDGITSNAAENDFNIYPNPNSGAFTLEVNMGQTKNMSIGIFDMLGNQVKELSNEMISTGIYNFDLSSLAAGNYLIRYTNDQVSISKKLTIIKN